MSRNPFWDRAHRCVDGRVMRHDPLPDDPNLETDIGQCEKCCGDGCDGNENETLAENAKLKAENTDLRELLSDARSGYISGSEYDLAWDAQRDVLNAEKVPEPATFIVDRTSHSYLLGIAQYKLDKARSALKGIVEKCAKIAEKREDKSDTANNEYDSGSGALGYELACREIAASIRNEVAVVMTDITGYPELGIRAAIRGKCIRPWEDKDQWCEDCQTWVSGPSERPAHCIDLAEKEGA